MPSCSHRIIVRWHWDVTTVSAKTAEFGGSRVTHACVMVIWPYLKGQTQSIFLGQPWQFYRAIRRRVAFAGTQLYENSHVSVAFVYGSGAIAYMVRTTFSIHRTWFDWWLALDKVRGHRFVARNSKFHIRVSIWSKLRDSVTRALEVTKRPLLFLFQHVPVHIIKMMVLILIIGPPECASLRDHFLCKY